MRKISLALVATVLAACSETPNTPLLPDSLRAASVTVTASASSPYEGDTVRFTGVVKDSAGKPMNVTVTDWTSSNVAAVTVDATGLATVVKVVEFRSDTVQISARFGRARGTATLTPAWRGPFVIFPDTNVLLPSMTRLLAARENTHLSGPAGSMPTVDTLNATWNSLNPNVVSVNATGQITAQATGTATIEARANGRVARALVTVVANPGVRFTSVSSGYVPFSFASGQWFYTSRACGLTTTGSVYCWGGAGYDGWPSWDRCEAIRRNGPGSYTLVTYRCREVPAKLETNFAFTSINTPTTVGCGITGARKIYCWGSNTDGELGAQSKDSTAHGVTAIASADEFRSVHVTEMTGFGLTACGVRTDSALVCWGSGFTPTPTVVPGGISWMTVADGGRCGLATDSTAYCLLNSVPSQTSASRFNAVATSPIAVGVCTLGSGQLYCGPPLSSPRTTTAPTTIDDLKWASYDETNAVLGPTYCALSGGDLYCGRGDAFTTRLDLGGIKVKSFSGNCAIATDDKVYCWRLIPPGSPASPVLRVRVVPGQ